MVMWSDRAAALEDDALLAAIGQGDDAAATVFVRRHQRAVYGLALTICRDDELAADLAQQTFERVWRHAASFDPRRGSVRTWVSTITRRLCIDVLRTSRTSPFDPDVLEVMVGASPISVEDVAVDRAEVLTWRTALAALPTGQRRAVLLTALGGHTVAEVAAIEGVPLGTAKTRLRQGLLRLRAISAEARAGEVTDA